MKNVIVWRWMSFKKDTYKSELSKFLTNSQAEDFKEIAENDSYKFIMYKTKEEKNPFEGE